MNSFGWKLPTQRQLRQRALSWQLRMVMGAIGTLYPHDKNLPQEIKTDLMKLQPDLKYIANRVRWHLGNIK